MSRGEKEIRVAVVYGGPSEEREVSLRSGLAVARALESAGYIVFKVDPVDGRLQLPEPVDVVFLALHGRYGEDGQIQEELEKLGVPYTGSGPEASRIGFDKVQSKEAFLKSNVPTPRFFVFNALTDEWPAGWQPPVVLKPARQGSSIGLQFVERKEELYPKLREAGRYGWPVLMEEEIEGSEATVGILDGEALPVVEVCPVDGHFDYNHKYSKGMTKYYCPARFGDELNSKIKSEALRAFNAIGARDYGRVDLRIDRMGNIYVLEVNTLPGMTETSLLPLAARNAGYSFVELCKKMIELALRRKPNFYR